jgi:hypothetical protein
MLLSLRWALRIFIIYPQIRNQCAKRASARVTNCKITTLNNSYCLIVLAISSEKVKLDSASSRLAIKAKIVSMS